MENSSTNQFGCSSIGIIPQNWASTRKKIIENPVVHRVSHEPVSIPKQTQCPPPTRPPRPSKPLPLLKRRSTSMVSRVLWMTGPNWWRHRIGHSYHAHFIGFDGRYVCVYVLCIYIYINRHNTYHIVLYIFRHNTYHIVLSIYIYI